MKAPITTHILDLQYGKPASGICVSLFNDKAPERVCQGTTDADGRVSQWDTHFELSPGNWTLSFATDKWFSDQYRPSFYSDILIAFKVESVKQHYHVPLLLSAFGYSTYRGS